MKVHVYSVVCDQINQSEVFTPLKAGRLLEG